MSTGGASCHMTVVLITGSDCGHNGNFYTSFIHVSSRSYLWPHIEVPIIKALYSSVKGRRDMVVSSHAYVSLSSNIFLRDLDGRNAQQ